MKLYAVIGYGPNNLAIPLVMFASKGEADAFVDQFPKSRGDSLDDDFAECKGRFVQEGEDDDELTDEAKELYAKLFKDGDYYAGCGGCYSIDVQEIETGQPMVGWDLD